jgi:hypothetical protein
LVATVAPVTACIAAFASGTAASAVSMTPLAFDHV